MVTPQIWEMWYQSMRFMKGVLGSKSLMFPLLVESRFIGGESQHIYERESIGRQSFSSSSFSCRAIEHNSIRSLSYVFLYGGILYVTVWMRWYLYAWGEKGEFWCLSWSYGSMSMCKGEFWYALMIWCPFWLYIYQAYMK